MQQFNSTRITLILPSTLRQVVYIYNTMPDLNSANIDLIKTRLALQYHDEIDVYHEQLGMAAVVSSPDGFDS